MLFSDRSRSERLLHEDRDCNILAHTLSDIEHLIRTSSFNCVCSPHEAIDSASLSPASPMALRERTSCQKHLQVGVNWRSSSHLSLGITYCLRLIIFNCGFSPCCVMNSVRQFPFLPKSDLSRKKFPFSLESFLSVQSSARDDISSVSQLMSLCCGDLCKLETGCDSSANMWLTSSSVLESLLVTNGLAAVCDVRKKIVIKEY